MAGTTKRSLAVLGLVIATAGSLAGCDREAVRNLIEHLQGVRPEQEGFEPHAVREVGMDEHGGRIVEVTIVSTRERSWSRASMAYNLVTICGEGRTYSVLERTPNVDPVDEDAWFADRPAGTRFVERAACEGPLPNEIAGHTGQRWDVAHRIALEQLKPYVESTMVGKVPGVHIRPGMYGRYPHANRYTAFHEALGAIMKDGWRECGGPVRVAHLVTIVPRPGTPEEEDMGQALFVGAYLKCDNTATGDAISVPAPPPPDALAEAAP
jgi:hypothetical protein